MFVQNNRECSVSNPLSHGTVARSSLDRSISRYVACTVVTLVSLGYIFTLQALSKFSVQGDGIFVQGFPKESLRNACARTRSAVLCQSIQGSTNIRGRRSESDQESLQKACFEVQFEG